MSPNACPSRETLLAFAVGALPEPELAEVAEHLDRCLPCGEQARALDGAADTVVGELRLVGDPGLKTQIAAQEADGRVEMEHVPLLAGNWGEFRIVREIGRGGMGVVYEAIQESLNRHVAVKLLREQADLARFRREARAAGRLHHTNIVPVHGIGEHAGRHFYIMQYIVGKGLDQALRGPHATDQKGPSRAVECREVARIGLFAAEALAYAHKQGILHRDIKPSNILLDEQGTVWVTDFGLAYDSADTETLTDTGDLIGTLRYMAPERFAGRSDAQSDIYALGATLYELATGRSAFSDTDRAVLMHRVLHQDPPRPQQINPQVPRNLDTIVLKAMARDPAHRYATATELAEDLRRFLEDRPIRGRRASSCKRAARWCRSNPVVTGMAGGIVLALLLGTAAAGHFAIRAHQGENLARLNESASLQNALRADREAQLARHEKDISDRRLYVAEMHLAQQAWQYNRPDLVQQHLQQFVPGVCVDPDLRGFEWFYLDRLCQASPPRLLASAGWDRTVKLWDVATTDQEAMTLRGHADGVSGVAFGADGCMIASAGWDRVVRLWDAVTGQELRTLRGHTGPVLGVSFHQDGRTLVSAGSDGTVRVWNAGTGQELRSLCGHSGPVLSVAFSPDGRWLITGGSDQTVRLWDFLTGQPIRALYGHSAGVRHVAICPDGRTLASASLDGTVKLWDPVSGGERQTLRGHTGSEVWGIAFSPDGRILASASSDQTIKLWDSASGRQFRTLRGHGAEVDAVIFSPDGRRLVSVSEDRTVKLWDPATGQEVMTLRGHTDQVLSVAFSPDGRILASSSGDGTVKLWDAGPLTPELETLHEARAVVQFFFAMSLTTAEVLDRIRKDPSLSSGTRRCALVLADAYGEQLIEHEAEQAVEWLYARPLLRPEVLASLRADSTLSKRVRQRALALVEVIPEYPERLDSASWAVVRRPGGDPAAYVRGLYQAEAACNLAPDHTEFRITLGAAQYRAGRYSDAVATLLPAMRLNANVQTTSDLAGLTFLALSQHQLGLDDDAHACLDVLNKHLKTFASISDQPEYTFLSEAEDLGRELAVPTDPVVPESAAGRTAIGRRMPLDSRRRFTQSAR